MKRIKILFTIILLTASLISCSKKNEIELKPNSTQVSGDLESYITVVDGTYKVENVSSDLILMIKLKIEKKIESQENVGLPWVFAGTTSKATFEHTGQIPGKMLFYRVKAQRNEQLSEPSNVAVAYAAGVSVPPVE
jgi:hypothetical protein